MKCPLCGAPTDIKESRDVNCRYVRRRECFNGHTFKTEEVMLTEPKPKKNRRDK